MKAIFEHVIVVEMADNVLDGVLIELVVHAFEIESVGVVVTVVMLCVVVVAAVAPTVFYGKAAGFTLYPVHQLM